MQPFVRPRLIIFDLDGTLLNTLSDIATAMNVVLASHGMPRHSVDAYRDFVGDGMRALVGRTIPEHLRSRERISELVDAMLAEYGRCWAQTSLPYEGISELLDRLQQLGIKLAILSNKPHEFTVEMTARLLGRWVFDPVVGVADEEYKKPDTRMASKILKMLDVQAEEAFLVGDSPVDIQTAKGIGMTAVGALWGFRSAAELRAAGADILIGRPAALFKYL